MSQSRFYLYLIQKDTNEEPPNHTFKKSFQFLSDRKFSKLEILFMYPPSADSRQ